MRILSTTIGAAVMVSVLLAAIDSSMAQGIYRYRLSGNWTEVTDGTSAGWGLDPNNGANNPPGPGLPGGSDEARISFGDNTVTVNSSVPAVNRVLIGVDEFGTVDVESGGSLTTNQDFVVGNNGVIDAELNVRDGGTVDVGRILWIARGPTVGAVFGDLNIDAGGTVNVASHLWWGTTGVATVNISGTLTQTGGILGLGTQNAIDPLGGTATVNILSGGVMALNNIDSGTNPDTTPRLGSIQMGSIINIQGTGQLTLPGDFAGTIENYRSAGRIVGNGITDNVSIVVVPGAAEGDFNADGMVDAADYTVWRDNLGGDSAALSGNGSGAAMVVADDYTLWRSNFGNAGSPMTIVTANASAGSLHVNNVAVPEPGAMILAGMLGGILLTVVRRRRV